MSLANIAAAKAKAFQHASSVDVATNLFYNVRNLSDISLHIHAGNVDIRCAWFPHHDMLIEVMGNLEDDLSDASTKARYLNRHWLLGAQHVLVLVGGMLEVTKSCVGKSKNIRLADEAIGRARMYATRLLDLTASRSPASTRDATAHIRLTQAETIAQIREAGITYMRTKEGLHRVDYRRDDPRRRVEIMPTAYEGNDLVEAAAIARRMCERTMNLDPVTRAKSFLSLAAIAIETATATA